MGTQNRQWCGKRGHGPDRSQNRLISAISQWRTQEESPNSGFFFPNSRCGSILTRVGAYENQYPKLFDVGVTYLFWVVSVFLFSVRKQKIRKISKCQKCHTTTRKSRKKHPESHLGPFPVDLTLSWGKNVAFHVKSACSEVRHVPAQPLSGFMVHGGGLGGGSGGTRA